MRRIWPESLERAGPFSALKDALIEWSEDDAQPLVLLVDEIDALVGDTLLAVLRQLRSGYDRRPASFPQSIVLCGRAEPARLPHTLGLQGRACHRRQRIQHQRRLVTTG